MNYKIVNKISELPNFDKDLPIFCDIETDDLYGPIRMIQMYQPSIDPIIYIVDIAPIGYNKPDWDTEITNIEDFVMSHSTVFYNNSYDLGCLNISPSMGIKHPDDVTKDTVYNERTYDLFYAMKMAYPEFMEFGLKKVVKKLRYCKDLYLGINTEDNVKGFVRGAYISRNAFLYAAIDVFALSLIWEDKKIQNIIKNNLAYRVDMMSQAYALIYQQNGLVLHRQMWEEKLVFAKEQVIKFTKLLPEGFNPNSFKQVRAFLDTNESNYEALVLYMASDNPKAMFAGYIIELKKYKKQVSYLTSIEFDRMFTKFNVYGTISGRFSSSGGSLPDHFNAQQIPRDFQKLFTQDIDNTTVIDLDYSTLELRLACSIFGSEHMYKQLKDGRDLHTEMATLVSGKSKPPEDYGNLNDKGLVNTWEDNEYLSAKDRHNAKGVNFGLNNIAQLKDIELLGNLSA